MGSRWPTARYCSLDRHDQEGTERVYRERTVFVAGGLLWYPVQGRPDICAAPTPWSPLDGRRGRGSYNSGRKRVAPQVVFEVLSPNNRSSRDGAKTRFYDRRYGVEEYFIYDPDDIELIGRKRVAVI